MACNAVAKLTMRVNADLSPLREDNPAVLALVRRALVPVLGDLANSIWPIDYRNRRPGTHPSAGAYEYYTAGISIDIYPDRIQIGHRSPQAAAILAPKIQAVAQALAGLFLQQKIKTAIAARAHIVSEQRTPAGALVLNLEV